MTKITQEVKVFKLIVTLLLTFLSSSLKAGVENSWTMEFRVAAHPMIDKHIIDLAQAKKDKEIYKEGIPVGKWVDVTENVEVELLADANLISRRNFENNLELLVLISPNDVTQNDVSKIAEEKGRWGEVVLEVYFTEEGSSKIFKQTKELLVYPEPSRYIAQIMDDKVYSVPMVRTPIRTTAWIGGDLTKEIIDDIERRSKAKRVYFEPPAGAITITPFRIAIFFLIIFILAFFVIRKRNKKGFN